VTGAPALDVDALNAGLRVHDLWRHKEPINKATAAVQELRGRLKATLAKS
jgi:hypothetical protein